MAVTTEQIKNLRDMTGAGIMDAKMALESSDSNIEKAKQLLFEKGLAKAQKRAGREANDGMVSSYVHSGGKSGALIQLSCETDFVAHTDEFVQLARDLAMQITAMKPRYVSSETVPEDVKDVKDEELLVKQKFIKDPAITVGDLIQSFAAKVGENIFVSRFQRFDLND